MLAQPLEKPTIPEGRSWHFHRRERSARYWVATLTPAAWQMFDTASGTPAGSRRNAGEIKRCSAGERECENLYFLPYITFLIWEVWSVIRTYLARALDEQEMGVVIVTSIDKRIWEYRALHME